MNTLNYKGYTAKIEFDPDDNILFGNIIGIRDTVGFHGESVTGIKLYYSPTFITRLQLVLSKSKEKATAL